MGWLFGPDYGPQLNRLEDKLDNLKDLVLTINRRTIRMSAQEQELNTALVSFFAAINDGLARIEAKLAEAPVEVDLSDEVAAIHAAQEAFQARVDADVPPPTP
jgi:hypothetical protein